MTDNSRNEHEGVPSYFYLLDFSRFLAAFAVVLWHYQHFFFPMDNNQAPLQNVFKLFYSRGFLAVDMFWVLSGFVISMNYFEKKSNKRSFWINRVARLYPLHLLTLLIVASLQAISMHTLGKWQIYQNNDLTQFFLHLIFVPGFQNPLVYSFNAPIWSVSLELACYALFSLALISMRKKNVEIALLVLTISIGLYMFGPNLLLFKTFTYFFAGVCIYFVLIKTTRNFALLFSSFLFILTFAIWLFCDVSPLDTYKLENIKYLSLFSGLVLSLVLFECRFNFNHNSRNIFKKSGDITYAMYLTHIPIQIAILITIDHFNFNRIYPDEASFLLIYLICVLLTSIVSFIFFENPLRKVIRRSLVSHI